jgi:glycosyltransferase involved in cell wall biosynthesis
MEKPLVSVIIPSYNHAPFLRERLDSILRQDYPNFEVFVLDDCSPDNSREIIEQYSSNPHIGQIVFNEQNTGNTFCQWHRGISMAKGKYVWIAESDDVAEPSFLSVLVAELERNPNAVLAYSYSKVIDQDSRVIYEDRSLVATPFRIKVYRGNDYIMHYQLRDNCIYNASMVVFRRDVYPRISPKFMEHRYCGDWFFWTCACQYGDVIEVREPLNSFRQHTNKVTVKSQKGDKNWIDAGLMMTDLVEELQLNNYQRRSLRFLWNRRLMRSKIVDDKMKIMRACPAIFKSDWCDYPYFKWAKNFGFLQLRSRMVLTYFNVPIVNH